MMRTPEAWAVAVRRPDGTIHRERHAIDPPVVAGLLRGLSVIVQAMRIGPLAARVAVRETMGAEPTSEQFRMTYVAFGVGALVTFVLAPGVLITAVGIGGAALEAGSRAAVLLLFLAIFSTGTPSQQLWRLHGAEHKTIAAYERTGKIPALTEARATSPVHERCGSTFLALFVIVSGVVFTFVPREPLWLAASLRIVLLPLIIAIAYEAMRAAAREHDSLWARAVTFPGRALQGAITVREPNDDELVVAIAALETLLA